MDTTDQGAQIEPLLPTVKSTDLWGQIFTYVDEYFSMFIRAVKLHLCALKTNVKSEDVII